MKFLNSFSNRDIALSAALAAVSAVLQFVHIGYQSPQWGMWIDVVAVSWVIAYFLLGTRASLLVTLTGSLIITLFAPDTWLGASMKLVATLPILFSLFIWKKIKNTGYSNPRNLAVPVIAGMIIRCAVVLPANYYYAIPIWTGLTPAQAIAAIPWMAIAGFNIVQSILDVALAWIVVYRFKVIRFKQG